MKEILRVEEIGCYGCLPRLVKKMATIRTSSYGIGPPTRQHFHPIELSSNALMDRALAYIHNNPVVAGHVEAPEFWRYSSAIDYCGRGEGLLDILFIE